MSLASWLNLGDEQKEKLSLWLESLPDHRIPEGEEDVCCSGHSFDITYYSTGLGDVFFVSTVIGRYRYICHLEFDDDDFLIKDSVEVVK